MKVYLNPFRRIIMSVDKRDEAFLHSLDMPYEALWEKEDVISILRGMTSVTQVCFGKFDLFNKWTIHSCGKEYGNEVLSSLRGVYLKPNRQCVRCPLFRDCMNIHLNFAELDILWSEIYLTKGIMFKNLKDKE